MHSFVDIEVLFDMIQLYQTVIQLTQTFDIFDLKLYTPWKKNTTTAN